MFLGKKYRFRKKNKKYLNFQIFSLKINNLVRFSRKSPSSGTRPRRFAACHHWRVALRASPPPANDEPKLLQRIIIVNCELKKPHPRGTAFVHCQRNYITCGAAVAAEPAADAARATSPAAASTTPHNAAGSCSSSCSFSSWHWPASAREPCRHRALRE